MVDALARGGGHLETAAPRGSFVSAYRTFLRPVLASRCPWLPSDSEFLVRGTRSCGVVPATYAAAARLLEEPDISSSRRVYVADGMQVRWFSSELRCER
jgi:hypothetical protein